MIKIIYSKLFNIKYKKLKNKNKLIKNKNN